MSALDAFSFTPREWAKLEAEYLEVASLGAEKMCARLLKDATKDQQKFLALGIMCGRASR